MMGKTYSGSRMSLATNTLRIQFPRSDTDVAVVVAGLIAVRYSGGLAIPLVVTTVPALFQIADAEFDLQPIDVNLQMILPVSDWPLKPGTRCTVEAAELRNQGIGVLPMVVFHECHFLSGVELEVVSTNDEEAHLRITGSIPTLSTFTPAATFELDANFEFRGFVDHLEDEPVPISTPASVTVRSRGNWHKYLREERELQSSDGVVSEYEWRHTNQLRRLCTVAFASRPSPEPPPAPSLAKRIWQRITRSSPNPKPNLAPEPPRPTVRQSKLLLAALFEEFLPEEECFRWNRTGKQMAQLIRNFAEGKPTAQDLASLGNYRKLASVCHYQAGVVSLEEADVLGKESPFPFRFLNFMEEIREMSDLFIWRLIPERSRKGCALLRDILGESWTPIEFAEHWRTDNVIGLALGAYERGRFDHLPMLADALEEAGCTNKLILEHCRADRPHVHGCWVIDNLLRKNESH
jgi:hypothetical protein